MKRYSINEKLKKANKNNWCLHRKNEAAKFIKEIKPLKSIGAVG